MATKNYYKKVMVVGGARLPSEYQEVEYIESTGTQFIDTGYGVGVSKISLYMVIEPTTAPNPSTYYKVFGAVNTTTNRMMIYKDTGTNAMQLGSSTSSSYLETSLGTYLTKRTIDVDAYTGGSALQTTIDLFNAKYYSSTGDTHGNAPAYMKLWSCIIKDANGNVVRNFVPCYRKSDSVIGMYDLVNSVFYTNSGTGTFGKGSDVSVETTKSYYKTIMKVPETYDNGAYQRVEYLESSGTQWFDTNYVLQSTDTIELKVKLNTAPTDEAPQYYHNSTTWLGMTAGKWWGRFGSSSSSSKTTTTEELTGEHIFTANSTGIKIDGETLLTTTYSSMPSDTLTFGYDDETYGSGTPKANYYYFKIYNSNDTLVRDFVPVKRVSDNTLGMWDKVNSVFYTNAGTGTFTSGDIVSNLRYYYKLSMKQGG